MTVIANGSAAALGSAPKSAAARASRPAGSRREKARQALLSSHLPAARERAHQAVAELLPLLQASRASGRRIEARAESAYLAIGLLIALLRRSKL